MADTPSLPVLPTDGHAGANPELRYYLHVLRRRWWVIALVAAVTVGGAVWRTSRRVPMYAAQTRVVRTPNSSPMDGGLSQFYELQPEAMAIQISLIGGVDVLHGAVEQLGLRLHITDPLVHRTELMRDVAVDSLTAPGKYVIHRNGANIVVRSSAGNTVASGPVGSLIFGPGFRFSINGDYQFEKPVAFSILADMEAQNDVGGRLRVEQVKASPIIQIRYSDSDPMMAANVANAVAQSYKLYSADRARKDAREARTILEDRLNQIRDSIRVAEQKVQAAQAIAGVNSGSGAGVITQQLINAQEQVRALTFNDQMLTDVKRSLDEKNPDALQRAVALGGDNFGFRETYNRIIELESQRSRAISKGTATEKSQTVTAIDEQIDDQKAELRRIADANQKIVKEKLSNAQNRVNDLQRQYGSASAQNVQVETMRQELVAVQRHYDIIAEKYYEAQIAENLDRGEIEITTPAEVPTSPTGSKLPRTVMLSLIIGLILGVVSASVLEQIDTRVRDPEDANRATAVGVIGMIPELKSEDEGRTLAVGSEDHTLAAEAYRKLRTNLRFVRADRPRAIAVTSPSPAEGKSVTAANLALAIAQQGQTVLLIDADLRRPVQHKIFGMARTPGLSDVVVGLVEPMAAIQPYKDMPNLFGLTCGTEAPNPAELLGSEAFQRFISSTLDKFDTIIIDTPPVMIVTDAAVISSTCDGVIIVAEAGRTERGVLAAAVNELRSARGSVIGIVLNRVGVGRASGRYTKYAYYSSREYYREGSSTHSGKDPNLKNTLRDWISALI